MKKESKVQTFETGSVVLSHFHTLLSSLHEYNSLAGPHPTAVTISVCSICQRVIIIIVKCEVTIKIVENSYLI